MTDPIPTPSENNDTVEALAASLGVTPDSLTRLRVRRCQGEFQWPERDADGEIIGTARRLDSGDKRMIYGSTRGLCMDFPLGTHDGITIDDPILIVEGMTDTAAGLSVGFSTVGRPSATDGLKYLKQLLPDKHVVVCGENDAGAGRHGAEKMASGLQGVAASAVVVYPPKGLKDLRAWVGQGADKAEILAAIRGARACAEAAPNDTTQPLMDIDLATCAPVMLNMADVEAELVDWLWFRRIPLGMLSVIQGDPDLGKSIVSLDMAARVSTGTPFTDTPNIENPVGGVVILSAEDDPAHTIRPRLDAAHADAVRVNLLQAVRRRAPFNLNQTEQPKPVEAAFDLTQDLPALEAAIKDTPGCRLVVIDPISAYLGRTDSHKNTNVRGVLAPLAALASRYRVAVVAVSHLNKTGAGSAMYRGMGSLAFTAAPRAVWGITKDKDDDRRRLMLAVKNNLAPKGTGLAYRIEATEDGAAPYIAWEADPVTISADEALALEGAGEDRGGAEGEAVAWLEDALSAGPVPANEVKGAAERDGIALRTLDRAKKALKVVSGREGFSKGRWMWRLPGRSAPTDTEERQPQRLAPFVESGALRGDPAEGAEGGGSGGAGLAPENSPQVDQIKALFDAKVVEVRRNPASTVDGPVVRGPDDATPPAEGEPDAEDEPDALPGMGGAA